jgi:hypothetical protein
MKLLNLTKRITDLLSITKLLTVFETYESEADAVRSFLHREGVTAELDVAPERATGTPPRRARPAMHSQSTPALLLASLRPEQWTKNLLVLAGVVFGGRLLEPSAVIVAVAAFVIFCALSGAVYLFNDIADRQADQNHPLKRERPIASGRLSTTTAAVGGVVLGGGGIVAALSIGDSIRPHRRHIHNRAGAVFSGIEA